MENMPLLGLVSRGLQQYFAKEIGELKNDYSYPRVGFNCFPYCIQVNEKGYPSLFFVMRAFDKEEQDTLLYFIWDPLSGKKGMQHYINGGEPTEGNVELGVFYARSKYLDIQYLKTQGGDLKYFSFNVLNDVLFPTSADEALLKLDSFLLACNRYDSPLLWKRERMAVPVLRDDKPYYFAGLSESAGVKEGYFIGDSVFYATVDACVKFLDQPAWIPQGDRCFFDGQSFVFTESGYLSGKQAVELAKKEYGEDIVLYQAPIPVITLKENEPFWLVGRFNNHNFLRVLVYASDGKSFGKGIDEFHDQYRIADAQDERFAIN